MSGTPQLKLPFTAPQLRDAGMKLALEHAVEKVESWGDQCFELLKQYIEINRQPFQAEFFRMWCETGDRIQPPPHKRAYGPILMRGAKEGLLRKQGYAPTSNPKAHCAPTTVWVRSDNE